MEQEQIIKRVEWLDEERRKEKTTIASLEERIAGLEGNLAAAKKEINGLRGEIARTSSFDSRMDQFDSDLAQYKVDTGRQSEAMEKKLDDRVYETEKNRRQEIEEVNRLIADLRKGFAPIPDIKKELKNRAEENARVLVLVNNVQQSIIEYQHVYEEFQRAQELYEETRKQDVKRLADIQGEVTSSRKRLDEIQGKSELSVEVFRKMDARINEIMVSEKERRESQTAFMDKLSLSQVERERTWKDWATRFEVQDKQSSELDAKLQALDSAQRAIDRSKQAFDEISQRIERRINEITEMQRLAEDRFRQEWVTYKADDQKRWINYTLVLEEQQKDANRQDEKLASRITQLEETTQQMNDLVAQIKDDIEKRLQTLLTLAHDWVGAYERTFGGK